MSKSRPENGDSNNSKTNSDNSSKPNTLNSENGDSYNSKTKIDEIREVSSAKGASMLVRSDIFKKLNGFDQKFFVTFEDVDLCWRSWILGYRVLIIPASIVYHVGGITIKKLKSEIAFHGFKNQISMKITNFETKLVFKKLLIFFIKYGLRESKIWIDYSLTGTTSLTPTKYEKKIAAKPSITIILKSLFWILTNSRYLIKKHGKTLMKIEFLGHSSNWDFDTFLPNQSIII